MHINPVSLKFDKLPYIMKIIYKADDEDIPDKFDKNVR